MRTAFPKRLRGRRFLMHRSAAPRLLPLLVVLAWLPAARGAEAAQAPENKPRSGLTVWDTGKPSAAALNSATLAGKHAWSAIPTERTAETFKGDAVVSNGRIVAVLRQQDSALAVHAVNP